MPTFEFGFKPASISSSSGTLSDTRTHHSDDYSDLGSDIPVVWLVVAGDRIIKINAGGRAATNGTEATGYFGFYVTDETGLTQGELVTSNIPVVTSSGAVTYYPSADLDIDLTPWVGKYIKMAVGPDSGFRRAQISGASGDMVSRGVAWPNPFGTTANQNNVYPMYAVVDRPSTSISLDSVTPNPAANSGNLTAIFSGNAASGTVKLIAGSVEVSQTVTSWTHDAGTNKTTVVSTIAQGGLPFGSVTARYTTGGSNIGGEITLAPISGNIQVIISGALDDPGYIFDQLESGDFEDVTHIEHTDSPNTVVSAIGLITQTVVGEFQARARDGSDNTWGSFATITPYLLFDAVISEQSPASVDAISGAFSPPVFAGAITEQSPASVDAIVGSFTAPVFAGVITEFSPAANDAIVGGFTDPDPDPDPDPEIFSGVIAEFSPASVDAITATFTPPVFAGAITEFSPASVDHIFGQFGDVNYQPSALRTFKIHAKDRTFKIRS